MIPENIIQTLLNSSEPAIRYGTMVKILGLDPESSVVRELHSQIPSGPICQGLLAHQDPSTGKIPNHPYTKWLGAHWVLACLADLGYPSGDRSLQPLMDQVFDWLLSPGHLKYIKTIDGRVRRCASQEGNALYASLSLGLVDDRTHELARRLIQWQWPDGGWNCDKRPEAVHSSFMESLIPLRALNRYAHDTGDPSARVSVERAAEIFLKRGLFRRQSDGTTICDDFVRLHYPCYWHFDILFGLKVIGEAGLLSDARCQAALDLLESRRLPDGGFPAEGKYYQVTDRPVSGRSSVRWGSVSTRQMNEFVTLDALTVLIQAGRTSRPAGELAISALGL